MTVNSDDFLTDREFSILKGITQDILRDSNDEQSLEGRMALERYADKLIQRINYLYRTNFNGLSYQDMVKELARARTHVYGCHLVPVPTWKGQPEDDQET